MHRLLDGAWISTTDFREVFEFIDDDSDENLEVDDLAREDEQEAGEASKEATPKEAAAMVDHFEAATPE